MKLSKDTLTILNNFSDMHQSVVLKQGNIIKTKREDNSMMAQALIDETFEDTIGIWELKKLLGVVNLFETPEFTFGEKKVDISENGRKASFVYSDVSLIQNAYKDLPNLAILASFIMNAEMMNKMKKSSAIMSLPHIAVVAENGKVKLSANDFENPTENTFTIKAGDADKDFRTVLDAMNFALMIPATYKVEVSQLFTKFVGEKVTYWVGNLGKHASF